MTNLDTVRAQLDEWLAARGLSGLTRAAPRSGNVRLWARLSEQAATRERQILILARLYGLEPVTAAKRFQAYCRSVPWTADECYADCVAYTEEAAQVMEGHDAANHTD